MEQSFIFRCNRLVSNLEYSGIFYSVFQCFDEIPYFFIGLENSLFFTTRGDALCIGGCRELADIEGGFPSGVVEQHGMLQQVDGGQDGVSSVKGALVAPWGLTPGA